MTIFRDYKESFEKSKIESENNKNNLLAELHDLMHSSKITRYRQNTLDGNTVQPYTSNSSAIPITITKPNQIYIKTEFSNCSQIKRGYSETSKNSAHKERIPQREKINDSQNIRKINSLYVQQSRSPLNCSGKQGSSSKDYLGVSKVKYETIGNRAIKDQFNSLALKLNGIPRTVKANEHSLKLSDDEFSSFKGRERGVKSTIYSVKYVN